AEVPAAQRCEPFFIVTLASWLSKTNETVLGQTRLLFINSKTNMAHERMQGTGVITIWVVGVFSSARRKRNHHDDIIRRAYLGVTSARLSASRPKPPLCSKR